jgi:predicted naringenin-chalcone synthase
MTFSIVGLGTAVPPTIIDQAESLRIAQVWCQCSNEQATWLPQMFHHSGIQNRHISQSRPEVRDVIEGTRHTQSVWLLSGKPDDRGPSTRARMEHYERLAGPLAVEASAKALDRSGLNPRDITHLITVSCTGFFAPGLDHALISGLDLDRGTERTQVGFMGCHGALNGLRVARAFTGADDSARVLLCAVELPSLHYHYRWDPQRAIANALFGDGAAAVVGVAQGRRDAWQVAASGSWVFPDSATAMTWTIGDHGFEMTLAKNVPGLIAKNLRPWMENWLQRHHLTLDRIASWAVHPGGPKILTAVEEALGLTPEQTISSRAILANYGNMSSATVLFLLDYLQHRRAPRPCVAVGFGPGVTAEATLFQ